LLRLKEHIIQKIQAGSIAEELELEAGDVLLSIDENEINDIFDYRFFTEEEYLVLYVRKKDGEEWELEIEKERWEDLGIEFESGLMDDYKSCNNGCIFCFIDQLPKGMRESLYFKDDDSRLSFLQGNYITLTNLKDKDLERIIAYHMGPINISVHTTNKDLRNHMLHNRFAGESLKKMDLLYEANIPMNGQIVLCKGVNDKEELNRSIQDLTKYMPIMESLSVVPVGLSKHREGLYPLEAFTKGEAEEVIDLIESWQERCLEEAGIHFVHASDEWYLLAGRDLAEAESYDGYLQLENGVGMLRLLHDEFMEALEESDGESKARSISMGTGVLAAPMIQQLAEKFMEKYPMTTIKVYPIENHFFGTQITVSGLLTGVDVIEQLEQKDLGEQLLLPANLLRSGEEVFLDDVTLDQVKAALNVPIVMVENHGDHLLEAMLGIPATTGKED
jgi:putative radical SAM enzyme (TIGR03279 family)